MVSRLPLVLGPTGLPQQLQPGDTLAGGGTGGGGTTQTFGSVDEAAAAIIPPAATTIEVKSFHSAGDGGGGTYSKVNSIPHIYSNNKALSMAAPSFATGAPYCVYATTSYQKTWGVAPNRGELSGRPILAGCLTVIVVELPPVPPPSTFTDTAGNTYTLAVTAGPSIFSGPPYPAAIYYCANPVYAPPGTGFNSPDVAGLTAFAVYCFPGFKDAVLGPVNSSTAVGSTTSASLSLSGMPGTGANFVFGVVGTGASPANGSVGAPFTYTAGAGWIDEAEPNPDGYPISCTLTPSTSITYNPTAFSPAANQTTVLLVSFNSATYGQTALSPAYWAMSPTWPVHAAQYGILPNAYDSQMGYMNFSVWLASVCPASTSSQSRPYGLFPGDGSGRANVTLSIASPCVVTDPAHGMLDKTPLILITTGALPTPIPYQSIVFVRYIDVDHYNLSLAPNGALINTSGSQSGTHTRIAATGGGQCKFTNPGGGQPGYVTIITPVPAYDFATPNPHKLAQGQMIAFFGDVPPEVVAGQRYYIQWGTVGRGTGSVEAGTPPAVTTFQISATGIFGLYGAVPVAKGTPIVISASSGYCSYQVFGDDWVDVVVDPGVYYGSQGVFPMIGYGMRKTRINARGAKFQTSVQIGAPLFDVNTTAPTPGIAYRAPINTVAWGSSGVAPFSVTTMTAADAAKFYPNSLGMLMCCEVQSSQAGNYNNVTFEFVRIRSVAPSTGVVTFWDPIRYGYRSTLPAYAGVDAGNVGFGKIGPATLVMLPDTFDQEVVIKGATFYGGQTQQVVAGIRIRFVECVFDGWSFKTMMLPTTIQSCVFERCHFRDCSPEIDKMIDHLEYKDCVFDEGAYFLFQSGSINMCIIDGCRTVPQINGTPKNLLIRNSNILGPLAIGPFYGVTERIILENSHIQEFAWNNVLGDSTTIAGWSFSAGSIKIADGSAGAKGGTWVAPSHGTYSTCPATWAVLNAKICIFAPDVRSPGGGAPAVAPNEFSNILKNFTVIDSYVDGPGNFCIDTDMAAFPTANLTLRGTISANVLTVTSVTPSDGWPLIGMNLAGGTLSGAVKIANGPAVPGGGAVPWTIALTGGSSPNNATPTDYTASPTLAYAPHPCPRMTVRGDTGGKFVGNQTGSPPDIPFGSYFNLTFNSGATTSLDLRCNYVTLIGNLTTWMINVIKPYTGTGASTATINMCGWKDDGTGNLYFTVVAQVVDLKTAGIRTIVPGSGAIAGLGADVLVKVPTTVWLSGGHEVVIATGAAVTPATMSKFAMVGYSDQGINSSSEVITTPTSGTDLLVDTVTGLATSLV